MSKTCCLLLRCCPRRAWLLGTCTVHSACWKQRLVPHIEVAEKQACHETGDSVPLILLPAQQPQKSEACPTKGEWGLEELGCEVKNWGLAVRNVPELSNSACSGPQDAILQQLRAAQENQRKFRPLLAASRALLRIQGCQFNA